MPSVTPEMVEKARAALHDAKSIPSIAVIMAEFAASAVQDAVSEIVVLMAEHRRAFRNTTCRELLVAALREKYGVKP